ncbi:MAG: tetratricopeptide repeat protein [Pirellulales bacterium]|nr:tetratricopeptide repeat protein [Pirellulales bacterium]
MAHPAVRFVAAVVVLTLAIFVWKFDVYDSPPYYDFATGLFIEANYLVESNFDYAALVDQPRWLSGGPAVYVVSIMPTVLALMMKALPSARAVLIAYHLLTFLLTAVALVLMYVLLEPRAGRVGAVLAPLAMFTAPLFSVQVDMLGMDLPLATCGVACLWCFTRQRYVWGAVACLLAVLIKATGAVLVLAALGTCTLLLVFSYLARDGESRRSYWIGAAAVFVSAVFVALSQDYLNALPGSASENWIDFGDDLRQGLAFQKLLLDWCPDQVALVVVALIATHFTFRGWLLRVFTAPSEVHALRRFVVAARDSLRDQPLMVFSWLMIAALFWAFISAYSLPRYVMIALPFLYLILGYSLFAMVAWRQWVAAAFGLIIAVNLLNSNGRLFPEFDSDGRTGAHLERSREYLRDHESNIAAVQQMAGLPENTVFVAGNPFVHFLSLPRLGYVERPRKGYSLNTYSNESFKSGTELPKDLPRDTVVVWLESALTPRGTIPRPEAVPGSDLEILYNDRQLHPLVVYRRRWSPEVKSEDLTRWYHAMLLPQLDTMSKALTFEEEGRLEDAAAAFAAAMDQQPDNPDVRTGYGRVLVKQKKFESALEQFREAVRLAPNEAVSHQLLGTMLFDMGRYDEAVPELTKSLELNPEKGDAQATLGRVQARLGNYAESEAAYAAAIRLDAENPAYRYELGNVLLMQNKFSEAIGSLREALRLRPDWPDAVNVLAWILSTNADDSLRNGAEAVELLERAQKNTEPDSIALMALLDTLAAAYAEVGRYDDAVKVQQQSIDLAKKLNVEKTLPGMELRLQQYQDRQPYRDPVASP